MARADAILRRFPAHLEAQKPGKLIRAVVTALAGDLDVQAASLAAIRRAHRLADADEETDLLLIAARHGIAPSALAVLTNRFARARRLADALAKAADDDERAAAAEAFLALYGLDGPTPKLALFADPGADSDAPGLDDAAAALAAGRVASAAVAALDRRAEISAARVRVATAIAIHAGGNGTVRALLSAAANALDLDIGPIHSSEDRYLHAAFAVDRLRLSADTGKGPVELDPAREVLGLEENPHYRVETDAVPRKHGEVFDQLRRGFERATLQIRVTGEGARTVGPMVVNRDEGHGVGFAGTVPGGERLVFDEAGRVRLGGVDVTPFAFAWRGACFADADAPHANDFVFAGEGAPASRAAGFAVAAPFDALDPDFAFPHAGDDLPMPGVAIGRTRFAFFVQEAHFSLSPRSAGGKIRRVSPRPAVGFFDASVHGTAPAGLRTASALVSFSWLERRAYAVRLMIPARFRAFEDDPDAPELRRQLVESLERFRPAGVFVDAAFVDERWILGQGLWMPPVRVESDTASPVEALAGGTVLWPAPT